jgi:hypothetical protein
MDTAVRKIIDDYTTVLTVIDKDAKNSARAYGGVVRATKGKLQEYITEEVIKIAWNRLGGIKNRLEINSKKIKIPMLEEYVMRIKDMKVKEHISANIDEYYYGLSVDKHIFIDGYFISGIECKAYTENAMVKRILVDFHLLKTVAPQISCYLFQLESQLGGDYSKLAKTTYGNKHTHSIMSYFPDVDLNIFTFLRGERRIEEPIHKIFKPLEEESVEKAIALLQADLNNYL